jgi:hypothetical protein
MGNGPMIRYEHDDVGGTTLNRLMFNGIWNPNPPPFPGFFESPNQPNVYTQIEAWYDLDFDGDGQIEWTFAERIELCAPFPNPGWNPPGGFICMQIHPVVFPWIDFNGNGICDYPPVSNEWGWHVMPNGQLVQVSAIEYGFLFDADVYNSPINGIWSYTGNPPPNDWAQVNNEAGPFNAQICDPSGICANINNPVLPPPIWWRDIEMQPIQWPILPPPWPPIHPTTQTYYCVAASGNEYSQHPNAYLNGQNLVQADGLFWYIEDYNINNNDFPPCGMQGWSGVIFCHFQA